ncbi:MAG: hypothetical protein NTV94_05355, partial [Planctomycetota bacterium]|nr:hypothetical protein [Planctomycetota bacterium]
MMPVVWGNPCGWPGMTATQCAIDMAFKVAQQRSLIREDDKEEWEANLTFYLLHIGQAEPCSMGSGLGQHESSLYVDADQVAAPVQGWPNQAAQPWLTPWFGRLDQNGEVIGGRVEARQWMDEFISAYIAEAAAQALPSPKFFAFDTEEVTADTWSLNGTSLLR